MSKRKSNKAIIAAIKDTGGIVSTIATRLGVTWNTARAWIDADPITAQAYQDEENRVLDVAEGTIIKSIQEGDTQDAKWLLSRKGKRRGYGDSTDITSGNEPLKPPQIIEIIKTYEKTDDATD